MPPELDFWSFPSELGWVGLVGHDGRLVRLVFGLDGQEAVDQATLDAFTESPIRRTDWNPDLAGAIVRFGAGSPVSFDQFRIDDRRWTPFRRRVLRRCRKIPYGHYVSYGDLAALAGHPGAARAVGTVMANNPVPLVIPCHRVVAAGDSLGGFSAPGGVATKARLLELERRAVDHRCEIGNRV